MPKNKITAQKKEPRRMCYMKLVRDKMPAVVKADGNEAGFRTMETYEFRKELREKLQEEVNEYLLDPSIEELADIQAVIRALAELDYGSFDSMLAAEAKKKRKRGGFTKRLYMGWVTITGKDPS